MVSSTLLAMAMHGPKALRYCMRFTTKTATIDEFTWSYLERPGRDEDTTEPVVFLHGFSSVKESWIHIASGIDKRNRVIVPDLPGHGRTKPADPTMDYSVILQAERLHAFLKKVLPRRTKVHVVGCSMGGMLAGVYAGKYPDHVRSVTMICPAGITMSSKSEAFRILEETGQNPLLAQTPDEIIKMNDMLSYNAKRLSKPIAIAFSKEREKNIQVYAKIANDGLEDPVVLDRYLPHIRARALVVWGENDRIIDVSSLNMLEKRLVKVPMRHIIRINQCGHSVHYERQDECINAINELLVGGVPSFVCSSGKEKPPGKNERALAERENNLAEHLKR